MSGIPGVPIDLVHGNVIPREIVERDLLPLIREAQAREAERSTVIGTDIVHTDDGPVEVPVHGLRTNFRVSAEGQRFADRFCALGPLGSEPS